MRPILNELSLFSGAGGGLIGSYMLDLRTIGYVEQDPFCQKVLRARIDNGILHNAPIFNDIVSFNCEGYAEAYKGMVDILTAGFPCPAFSVAGKQLAGNDERNVWPETIETIRIVRPRYALLENVAGLLSRRHRYFEKVLEDLSNCGYDAVWKVISAAELGAPHKRDRIWVVANSTKA